MTNEELEIIKQDATRFVDELKDKVHEQHEEIQQLKEELTKEKQAFINMYNQYVEKENIINELEKYCNEEIEDYNTKLKYYENNKDLRSRVLDLVGEYEGEKVCFEDMLEKLQELKGSDKE